MPGTVPKFAGAVAGRHLGRKPATDAQRKKMIPLRPFLLLEARPVPPSDDYATQAQGVLTQMLDNDREGCCVATALAKVIGMMNAYRPGGKVVVATDAEVSRWYHAVGGPGDNGLYMPDAFNYAMTKGFTVAGQLHKIDGFCVIDNGDNALLDAAFHWFGGVQLGVNLTSRQYQNAEDTDTWEADGTPVVGGHAVPLTKRAADKFTLATWARQPSVTRACVNNRRWCDECYVVMGPDWFDSHGIDTNKVNVEALRAAFAAVKAGGTPDIPDDPNPPAPPDPNPPGPNPPVPVPGDWTWEHTWTLNTFLGQVLVHLGVKLGAEQAAGRGVNWWSLLTDVAALARAIWAKDWTAAATAALAVLADLGLKLGADSREALTGVLRGMGLERAQLPPRMFEPVGHARESANAV